MKKALLLFLLIFSQLDSITAQNDYLVNTSSVKQSAFSPEEDFVQKNFPLMMLSEWTPGLKFMFRPSARDKFIPIFANHDNENEVNNALLKEKIMEFIGTEEKVVTLSIGETHHTRLLFKCEDKTYYHEIKNLQRDEIDKDNPRRTINGLVYLKDVDSAKALLVGRTLYYQSNTARIDDPNSYSGYREVPIAENSKVVIKAVGVGSSAYPVKLVFEDESGGVYYQEVALSRTNSGLNSADFQSNKKYHLFSNAFSFADKKGGVKDLSKEKYLNCVLYPNQTIQAKARIQINNRPSTKEVHIPRYTPLLVKEITFIEGTLVWLRLADEQQKEYEVKADMKYDVVIKNDNYIENLFTLGDIKKKYPSISEAHWALIAQGQVSPGMTMDECRLALGEPIEIRQKTDKRFETWFYQGHLLEFESGRLLRGSK